MKSVEERAERLTANTVMLSVETSFLGNRVKLDASSFDLKGADPEYMAVSKRLMKGKAFTAIQHHFRSTRSTVQRYALPSFFRGGVYMCNLDAVEELDRFLSEQRTSLRPLVDALVASMDEIKAEAKDRLGSLYSELDYPTEQKIRDSVDMGWAWFTFETPDSLSRVSGAIMSREIKKAKADIKTAVGELTASMREQFAALVEGLVERLGDDPETGKPKLLMPSSIKKLSDFVEFFDVRNVTNDSELAKIVNQAKKISEGYDVKKFRKEPEQREQVRNAFIKLAKQMGTMPQQRRTFAWDED